VKITIYADIIVSYMKHRPITVFRRQPLTWWPWMR